MRFSWLARILDLILPPRDTARIVRECVEEEFLALLCPVVTETGIVALLPYRHRLVRSAIIEAKFRRDPRAIRLLALALAEYLADNAQDERAFAPARPTLVPVPLGPLRRRERGYNQVEEIARAAGAILVPFLARTRETLPQTTLPRRKRLENMRDAFALMGPPDLAARYIVLDDVVTTGATLRAAQEAFPGSRAELLALAH